MHLHLVQSPDERIDSELAMLGVKYAGTKDRAERYKILQQVKALRAQRSAGYVRRVEKDRGLER